MQLHEVRLHDGQVLYGLIGYINHHEETFNLLDQNTIGMIGDKKAGRILRFDEVRSVYAMTTDSTGRQHRESNEQMSAWRQWAHANLSKIKIEGS